MTYSKLLPLRHFTLAPLRSHVGLVLATAALAVAIAGCGSSSSSSTIGVNNQNSSDSKLAASGASEAASTPATPKTPTTGPLSKEPKITPPTGAAPSKLVVKDIIKGTGAEAKAGGSVSVNYVGVLFHGGKEFDASWKRNEPFPFKLGAGQVIPGWDQGVAGMRVGGRRELIIPAPLAYGPRGSGSAIPPNAPLVFVVDLLSA